MRVNAVLLIAFFLCCLVGTPAAAEKYSYDRFYKSDAKFKALDKELNASYKQLMTGLPWHDRNALLYEQRAWHDKFFPRLAEENGNAKNPGEAALNVLGARVNDFKKLLDARSSSEILGLKLAFGMTKNQVAASLGLREPGALNATPENPDNAYKIRLFGKDAPLFFTFENTKFLNGLPDDPAAFNKFTGDVLKTDPTSQSAELATLVAVSTGDLDDKGDYGALLEELEKKYKTAWPSLPSARITLEDDLGTGLALDDEDILNSSQGRVFEDRQKYIILYGSWGTMTGSFDVTYAARAYVNMHLTNARALIDAVTQTARLKNSLGILPANADIMDVVYALGNREITFTPDSEARGYYILETEIKYAPDAGDGVQVYLTPENKAFACNILYVDNEGPNDFETAFLKNIAKKYSTLQDTPEDVLQFLGFSSNYDQDFETEDNYIHIGFTPHFATQHNLLIIDKGELKKYRAVQKIGQEKLREAEAAREKEAREDIGKF